MTEFLVIDKPIKLTVPAPWNDTINSINVFPSDINKLLYGAQWHFPIRYVKHVNNQSR